MLTDVARYACVEYGFASAVHVFSAAMRQEECAFLCLEEWFSQDEVGGLDVDEVLDKNHSVLDV